MAKLIVKDPKTGDTRPMTQKVYDLAGKKKGFTIVGHEKEEKSAVQQEMDRLRAEKAQQAQEEQSEQEAANEQPEPIKRGRKPKKADA